MISHVLLDDSHCLSRVELDDGVYSPPPGGLVGEFASVPGARDDALLGEGPQVVDENQLAEVGRAIGGVVVRLRHVLVGVGILAQPEVLAGVTWHLHRAMTDGVGKGGVHALVTLAPEDRLVLQKLLCLHLGDSLSHEAELSAFGGDDVASALDGAGVHRDDREGCGFGCTAGGEEWEAHHVVLAWQEQQLCVVGQGDGERGVLARDAPMLLELRGLPVKVVLQAWHNVPSSSEVCNSAVSVNCISDQVSSCCCR